MAGRGDIRSRKSKKVGRANGIETPNSKSVVTQDSMQSSRFEALQMLCRMCDETCEENGTEIQSIKCVRCNLWAHTDCLFLDKKDLEEQNMKGTYLCDACKNESINSSSHKAMDTSESTSSSSMNSEDKFRLEFDGVKASVQTPISQERVGFEQGDDKVHPNQGKDKHKQVTSTPKSTEISTKSTEKEIPRDQIVQRLDKIDNWMEKINIQVKKNDSKIKLISAETNSNLSKTTFKLTESVNSAVGKAFDKIEARINTKLESEIEDKFNQGFSDLNQKIDGKIEKKVTLELNTYINENLDTGLLHRIEDMVDHKLGNAMNNHLDKVIEQKIGDRIGNAMNEQIDKKLDEGLDQVIDAKIDDRIGDAMNEQLDRKMDEGLDQRVGDMMNQKIDTALDEFHDSLWREKNLLIVNVPESNKRSILDKKEEDFITASNLFNKLVRFDDREIDGLPVRIGKISGDKPRMIRVTLRSEIVLKDILHRARNENYKLNPIEKDNKKKIYINRDFSMKVRDERKEVFKEKKRLEALGEKCYVRKNKLIQAGKPHSEEPRFNRRESVYREELDQRDQRFSNGDQGQDRNDGYANQQYTQENQMQPYQNQEMRGNNRNYDHRNSSNNLGPRNLERSNLSQNVSSRDRKDYDQRNYSQNQGPRGAQADYPYTSQDSRQGGGDRERHYTASPPEQGISPMNRNEYDRGGRRNSLKSDSESRLSYRDDRDRDYNDRSPGRDRSKLSRGEIPRENSLGRHHREDHRIENMRYHDPHSHRNGHSNRNEYRSSMVTRQQSRERANREHDDLYPNRDPHFGGPRKHRGAVGQNR